MKDLVPGEIVIIKPPGPIGFTIVSEKLGTLICVKQSYWDFGEGDYGFVDVAEILVDNKLVEVACSHLAPF